MKISLVERMKIYAQGKYPHFFNGGEFEVLGMQNGYKAANSGRRAREMVEAGILERRIGQGGSVEYRWIPTHLRIRPQEKKEKESKEIRDYDRALVERINSIPARKSESIQTKLI